MSDASILPQCQLIFDLALQLHQQTATLPNADQLKQQARHTIESLQAPQLTEEELRSIRYALAALLDERVAYSTWTEKSQWLAQPLQVILFGDHLAGEKFFDRLTKLQTATTSNRIVLQVYYICLQLDFQGKYRLQDPQLLVKLKQSLNTQLLHGNPANQQNNTLANPGAQRKWWHPYVMDKRVIYGSALGGSSLLYVIYQIISWFLPRSIG